MILNQKLKQILRSKTKITTILILAVALAVTGFGCKSCSDEAADENIPPVELNFWGLWDDESVMAPILDEYKLLVPYVSINYQKFTFNEYESMIVNSLAAGRGPDIWMIHNTWMPKHNDKITCSPQEIINGQDYLSAFVDVVSFDLMIKDYVCGVALSVDTMALYYNKDLLNTAHIAQPPENWSDFKDAVEKMTKLDDWGNITQAGAAMGTSKNINRAVDILYLLMLQNGTQMVDLERYVATFNDTLDVEGEGSYNPGLVALQFYTDFASPRKKVYTWNPTLPNSIEAFTDEKVAMMFNYSYQAEELDAKAPRLNYDIAPMPQIKETNKEINYANYWAYVVSSASENSEESWRFLSFLAGKQGSEKYTEMTGRPAARRDIIQDQMQVPHLKIFANQAITARSWYQVDEYTIEGIFDKLIDDVVLETEDPEEVLSDAEDKVTTLMSQHAVLLEEEEKAEEVPEE